MLPSGHHQRPASGPTKADSMGQFTEVPGCDRQCYLPPLPGQTVE